MEVHFSRFEDAGERDEQGCYDYYYSGQLLTFRDGPAGLVARRYDDESHEAHFLADLRGEGRRAFTTIPYRDALFRDAVSYLVDVIGVSLVRVLLSGGYVPVDLERARLTRPGT